MLLSLRPHRGTNYVGLVFVQPLGGAVSSCWGLSVYVRRVRVGCVRCECDEPESFGDSIEMKIHQQMLLWGRKRLISDYNVQASGLSSRRLERYAHG